MSSNYPATSYPEGVDLTIIAGNQLHQVINGDADKVISTDGGDIPSVRKALADIGAFKPPINWVDGAAEEDPFQVRLFTDGSYYWAPSATNTSTIPMGSTPIGDPNWKLAPLASNNTVSNTNLLSNHNFLKASPDASVTPPSEATTNYPAGTQIFSGWYAGASGVSLKKENSLITVISGSLYQDIPRNNGLELVNNFIASVSYFQGTPTTSNVSHSVVSGNFRVTISDGAVDVGSVKFEQGSIPTQHEVVEVVTERSIGNYTDIVYKASGGKSPVENMISGAQVNAKVGDKVKTETMVWEKVSSDKGDINDFKSIGDISMLAFGYGAQGNTPEQNYERLVEINNWLATQNSVGTIKHPSNPVSFKTTIPSGTTKKLGDDIASLQSFVFDFNGGKMIDETDVSTANSQLVIFSVRDSKLVKFINVDIEGQMPIPEATRRGTTLCRAYNADYAEFNGTSTGMLNNLETRFCKVVVNKGSFTRVRYPFLTFNCGQFDYDGVTEGCWRDFFVQGGSGEINCTSEKPHQHSLLKSYNSTQNLENITGYYKARNRPTPVTPTGQVGLEIQSDDGAIFRNIHLDLDIEGEYERPFMLRNFKSDGSDQDAAKGHVLHNIKFSGRYKNTTGNTGNLFVVGGGYNSGDYIQNFSFDDLTVVGSFVVNLDQLIPAIDASNKMKWQNFTITDAYLQNHDQGFYAEYLRVENVNFPGKAYSSNGVQECGVLKFTKKYIANLSSGVPLFTTDSTRTFNQVVINYCATNSESAFNPFAEGRLSGLVVYPSSGSAAEYVVDTQFSKSGTTGVADLYEVSAGVFGFRIPEWISATSGMAQIDAVVNYSSYGEDDFSSIPGLVYEPYKSL